MKLNRLLTSVFCILAIGAGAATSSFKSSPPSVSRPSGASLYSKPSVSVPKAPTSGGYLKPSVSQPVTETRVQTNTQTQPKANAGYVKPAIQDSPKAPSSGGYQKATASESRTTASQTAVTTMPPTAGAKGNRFDSKASETLQRQKSQASLAAYEADKKQFKAPPVAAPKITSSTIKSDPVMSSAKKYGNVGYNDIQSRRNSRLGNWQRPVYVYNVAPSYGHWSSDILWWSMIHDSSFYYHHQNDPAVQAWHADAMRLAEQNGELKAQLAAMDARVDSMQNTPRNAGYLPAQVAGDPLVALSKEAIDAIPVDKPTLRVATGIQGGRYSQIGALLKKKAGNINIELVSTSGAAENLELLQKGKVDAAIVQSDTDFVERRTSSETPSDSESEFHRATVFSEYVMLVVSKDSPIKTISDLGKDNTVYVGPEGSGSSTTWKGLVMEDAHYKEVNVANLPYETAFDRISADKNKALLFVAGMRTPMLQQFASTGKYRVVPVDDKDLSMFKDKDDHIVYDTLTLTADTYPGLQVEDVKTLAVDAEWTLSKKWIEKYGDDAFDQINYAVIDVISDLHMGGKSQTASTVASATSKSGSHWFLWLLLTAGIGFGLYFVVFKMNVTGGNR